MKAEYPGQLDAECERRKATLQEILGSTYQEMLRRQSKCNSAAGSTNRDRCDGGLQTQADENRTEPGPF